jgi:hypothetical protein
MTYSMWASASALEEELKSLCDVRIAARWIVPRRRVPITPRSSLGHTGYREAAPFPFTLVKRNAPRPDPCPWT